MLDMSARAVEFISRRFRILPLSMAGAPVYFAAALPGPGTDSEAMLLAAARPSAGRVPSGRGLSQASALAGCLGEAAELISASFWGDENFVRAPFSAVRSEAIHPASLLLFSDQQYHQRQAWNAANRDEWVPVPYDDERLIEWVEGASPDDDRRVLIPAAFAYIGYAAEGAAWTESQAVENAMTV